MSTTNMYTISTNGISLGMESTGRPVQPPKALIATRAVQVQDGWIGQVIVDSEIVMESLPFLGDDEEDGDAAAQKWANSVVVDRIKALFKEPA